MIVPAEMQLPEEEEHHEGREEEIDHPVGDEDDPEGDDKKPEENHWDVHLYSRLQLGLVETDQKRSQNRRHKPRKGENQTRGLLEEVVVDKVRDYHHCNCEDDQFDSSFQQHIQLVVQFQIL